MFDAFIAYLLGNVITDFISFTVSISVIFLVTEVFDASKLKAPLMSFNAIPPTMIGRMGNLVLIFLIKF